MLYDLFKRRFLVVYQCLQNGTIRTASVSFDGYNVYTDSSREQVVEYIAKRHQIPVDKVLIINIIQLKRQFLWWYF